MMESEKFAADEHDDVRTVVVGVVLALGVLIIGGGSCVNGCARATSDAFTTCVEKTGDARECGMAAPRFM